jgi:hypothetical protein
MAKYRVAAGPLSLDLKDQLFRVYITRQKDDFLLPYPPLSQEDLFEMLTLMSASYARLRILNSDDLELFDVELSDEVAEQLGFPKL